MRYTLNKHGFKADCDCSGVHGGTDVKNVCNRSGGKRGVQIEIPMKVRKKLFHNVYCKKGRTITTKKFAELISGLKSEISNH